MTTGGGSAGSGRSRSGGGQKNGLLGARNFGRPIPQGKVFAKEVADTAGE
jgi:hypothetical protein